MLVSSLAFSHISVNPIQSKLNEDLDPSRPNDNMEESIKKQ